MGTMSATGLTSRRTHDASKERSMEHCGDTMPKMSKLMAAPSCEKKERTGEVSSGPMAQLL